MTAGAADPGPVRELVRPDDRGRGNRVLLVGEGGGARVLKIFRRRRPPFQEFLGELAARIVHAKRGVTAQCRYETERATVEAWSRHGFDVPRILDLPPPGDADGPALWYEHCGGTLLWDVLEDPALPWRRKEDLIRRLASGMARRHRLALERHEPLLIQEHATVKHVIACGERLVTFDFEGAYGPRHDLREALVDEVSGVLRSVSKSTGDRFSDALAAFAGGYSDRELLRAIVERGTRGKGLRRLLKRFADRRRRREHGKTEVLERLRALLEGPPAG